MPSRWPLEAGGMVSEPPEGCADGFMAPGDDEKYRSSGSGYGENVWLTMGNYGELW